MSAPDFVSRSINPANMAKNNDQMYMGVGSESENDLSKTKA